VQPLDASKDDVTRSGQTVPVKVRALDAGVFDAGATVTVAGVAWIDGSGSVLANAVRSSTSRRRAGRPPTERASASVCASRSPAERTACST
jgi:hypothetical protein